jgi:NitT/TauT family transport system substrate-binding protein
MRKVGMEDKRDYTIIEAPLPAMKAMLAEKKVDLIPASIPFAHDPELKSISRMLFTQREIVGSSQTLLLAARTGYIEKNRAALVDFMEDIIRARRFYLDPANQKEAVQIIANFTKQPPRNYEGWLFTKEDAFRDPMAMPNVEAMQRNIALQRELGFLKTAIDVNAFSDLSMVREAGPRAK